MNWFKLVFYNLILITITFFKYGQADDTILDTFTLVHFRINDLDENTIEQAPSTTIRKLNGALLFYEYRLITDETTESYISFHQNDVNFIYFYGNRLVIDVDAIVEGVSKSLFVFGVFDTTLNAQRFSTAVFDAHLCSSFEEQEYKTEFTIKEVRLFVDGQKGESELVAKKPYVTVQTTSDNEHDLVTKIYAFHGRMTDEELEMLFLLTPATEFYLTQVVDDLKVVLYLSRKMDWKYVFYFEQHEHAEDFVNAILDDLVIGNFVKGTQFSGLY